MTIDNVLEILEKHKLYIPSNVFYELKADIVNFEEPTTKNDLGVDKLLAGCEKMSFEIEIFNKPLRVVALDAVKNIVKDLFSVTPQYPRKGYLSIDDVMSVFDDFMCGEVDEDGTETFLEMLKDRAESERT